MRINAWPGIRNRRRGFSFRGGFVPILGFGRGWRLLRDVHVARQFEAVFLISEYLFVRFRDPVFWRYTNLTLPLSPTRAGETRLAVWEPLLRVAIITVIIIYGPYPLDTTPNTPVTIKYDDCALLKRLSRLNIIINSMCRPVWTRARSHDYS